MRGHEHPRHGARHRGREKHHHQAAGGAGRACAEYQDGALFDLPCTEFSATKSGRSATPRRRTCPMSTGTSSATATCGPGPRSAPTPSWSPRGWWVSAPRRRRSFHTGLGISALQPRPAHHRRPTSVRERSGDDVAGNIDYAMLHKIYESPGMSSTNAATAPPSAPGSTFGSVNGDPDLDKVSHVATWSARTSPCGWACAASPA